MKTLYIDRGITQSRIAILNNDSVEELYIENHDDKSISGNIYKGRIENTVQGLDAVFINIGENKNAIMHFDDIGDKDRIKRGQEIIVQVTREAVNDKGPKVTEKVSLPGKYIVLLPNSDFIGISQKITDINKRTFLKKLTDSFFKSGYGMLVRTEAVDALPEKIEEDYQLLVQRWDKINQNVTLLKPPILLYTPRDFLSYAVRQYVRSDLEKIYINRKQEVPHLEKLINECGYEKNIVVEYLRYGFDKMNIVEKEIAALLENRMELESGGFLVIHKTEALTAIDVNSGSYVNGANLNETVFKTNIDAVKAIYKIVTKKNISGIILIDFIDMNRTEYKMQVLEYLRTEFKNDKNTNRIYGFTKLGLVEMVRSKKGKSLTDNIYFGENPEQLNVSYCLKLIENHCIKMKKQYFRTQFTVYTAEYIYNELEKTDFKKEMHDLYEIDVTFKCSRLVKNYYIDVQAENSGLIKIEANGETSVGKLLEYAENKNGNITIVYKPLQ